jgi:hypothetical protein
MDYTHPDDGFRLRGKKLGRLANRMNALKTPKQNDSKNGNQHRFRNQKEKVATIGSILPHGGRLPFSDKRNFLEELDFVRHTLDATPAFTRFWKQVRIHCLSFPLILHNRAKIVDIITKHIQEEHNVATKSILNLTVKLAATIGSEFYLSFRPLVLVLVNMMKPTFVEETAMFFKAIAYLFKYMAPFMIRNELKTLDPLYGRLLGHEEGLHANICVRTSVIFVSKDGS